MSRDPHCRPQGLLPTPFQRPSASLLFLPTKSYSPHPDNEASTALAGFQFPESGEMLPKGETLKGGELPQNQAAVGTSQW